MSTNGGQALGAVLPAGGCKVIWLPGVAPAAAPAPRETDSEGPGRSGSATARRWGPALRAVAAIAVAAGQVAALPLLAASGGNGNPWTAGATFGFAAAIAAWLAAPFASGQASRAHRDLALHDAFALSLIVAASALLGNIGAALLLPAGTALSLTLRRLSRGRTAAGQEAMLLLLVAIAVAGLCGASGRWAWAVAAVALAAAVMVKAGHSCVRGSKPRPMWHIWGMSAILCAAIAFTGQAALGPFSSLPLVAGGIYGAAAGASARILSRRHAQALSAAVPFLAAGVEAVLGEPFLLTQMAAAVLLAAALAGANRRPAPHREAAIAAPNGWPAGWPL